MELLALILIVGALWGGYRVGLDAGRTQILEAQSQSIRAAISSESEFFRKTGIHGAYLLEGHEYRSPADYVIVKFSDLEGVLARATRDRVNESEA